jgi:hypothetical protein
MSARYVIQNAPLDSLQVRNVRVRHILRRVNRPPVTSREIADDPAQLEIVLRALFGSHSATRAAKALAHISQTG